MPLQYSIRHVIPDTKAGSGKTKTEYISVPREVAESHEEGCYALFNSEGEQISIWAFLNVTLEAEKPSKRVDVKDSFKQPLSIGDFVAYNRSNVNSPIAIGIVTGFTNKQVRVAQLSAYSRKQYSTLLYESSLIRVPEEYWTGTL